MDRFILFAFLLGINVNNATAAETKNNIRKVAAVPKPIIKENEVTGEKEVKFPVTCDLDDTFPVGESPIDDDSINYESIKDDEFWRHEIASFAPCLLINYETETCEDSQHWVWSLAGATGSVTQMIKEGKSDWENLEEFTAAVKTDGNLQYTVGDHAACIKGQVGGVPRFLNKLANFISKIDKI